MSLYKILRVSADLAYKCIVTECAWLSEARWTETVINLFVEYSLIPAIDCSIHHRDKDTLFTSCLLHEFPFIRLHAYHILLIICSEKLLLFYVFTFIGSQKKHLWLPAFTSFHMIVFMCKNLSKKLLRLWSNPQKTWKLFTMINKQYMVYHLFYYRL